MIKVGLSPHSITFRSNDIRLADIAAASIVDDRRAQLLHYGALAGGILITVIVAALVVAKGFPDHARGLHMLVAGPLLWGAAYTSFKLKYNVEIAVGDTSYVVLQTTDRAFADELVRLIEVVRANPKKSDVYQIDARARSIVRAG